MNIGFSGKVVLVAGGTGGLGRDVSLAFLREGAKVVVSCRKEEEFAALKAAAGPTAPALYGQIVDITTRPPWLSSSPAYSRDTVSSTPLSILSVATRAA